MRFYLRQTLAVVGCLLALGASGCSERDAEPGPTQGATTPAQVSPAADKGESASPRLRIVTAQSRITVKSFAEARTALEALVAARKGYIENTEVQQGGSSTYGTLTLRIPADQLATTMSAIAELGKVNSESVQSEDVSDQLVDLEARLKSARALERRLQALVESGTSNVGEVLQVEKELARVRGEIERMDASEKSLSGRVAMSTLTVQLSENARDPAPAGLATAAWNTVEKSATMMAAFGRALLLLAAGLLPWSPLLAFGIWLAMRWMRKHRARVLANRELWMQQRAEWAARNPPAL